MVVVAVMLTNHQHPGNTKVDLTLLEVIIAIVTMISNGDSLLSLLEGKTRNQRICIVIEEKIPNCMSSLIEPTFALESRNKNDSDPSAEGLTTCTVHCTLYNVHCTVYSICIVQTNTPLPTIFLKTATKSSGAVFIVTSSFL